MKKLTFSSLSLVLWLTFFSLLTLASCSRQKQVWLSQVQRANEADRKNIIRVYLDKFGDYYPSPAIYLDYRDFMATKGLNDGSLEDLFTKNHTYSQALAQYYHIDTSLAPHEIYQKSQQQILAAHLKEFSSLTQRNNYQKVVVLIHGFNDPNPTGDYQEVRSLIRSKGYDKGNILYLEVYWDGLTSNGGSAGFEQIWGRAQLNSRYVALGLRSLLKGLPTNLPAVIITHSLGASVATGALFNTTCKWKNTSAELNELLKDPTPTHPFRLGLIAPAIPGVATFRDYNKRARDFSPEKDNIEKIVVGFNNKDYALNKGMFNRSNFLATKAGATTLGVNYKNREISNAIDTLKKLGYPTRAEKMLIGVEFHTRKFNSRGDQEHSLHFYLINNEQTTANFLKLLFEN